MNYFEANDRFSSVVKIIYLIKRIRFARIISPINFVSKSSWIHANSSESERVRFGGETKEFSGGKTRQVVEGLRGNFA